jgi:NADPH:quinone reductase-like Zn-dependent oxidoreductase
MMRAIVVKRFGPAEAMEVGEVPVPEPRPGEILVRVLAAGVGPWDVELRRGEWTGPVPYVPGAEFAGLVVGDTGADASFDDGTLVYGWPGPGGCYAEYVTCDVQRLAPIPGGLSVTEAAAVPVDAVIAEQGMTDILRVGASDRVLIADAAAGPGRFAVQIARALGAVVIATANPRDHELMHKLGAAVVLDQTAQNWPDQAREEIDGGAERVLACTAASLAGAARAARDGAVIATPVRGELPDAGRVDWKRYAVRPDGSRLIRLAPWFEDGSLSVQLSAQYPLADAPRAHLAVEQGHAAGDVVLVVDDDLAAELGV